LTTVVNRLIDILFIQHRKCKTENVNFDNFNFCSTILLNDVIETSDWFYFLSNTLCYIQIKFHDYNYLV